MATETNLNAPVILHAVCWSPKGKQLVVGRKNGSLTQLDQQLKPKRDTPNCLEPPFNTNCTVIRIDHSIPFHFMSLCTLHCCPFFHRAAVIDVFWLSTFVFVAAFKNLQTPEETPVIAFITLPVCLIFCALHQQFYTSRVVT